MGVLIVSNMTLFLEGDFQIVRETCPPQCIVLWFHLQWPQPLNNNQFAKDASENWTRYLVPLLYCKDL
jgi:hypothetical protein